jgi:hypothetical protein
MEYMGKSLEPLRRNPKVKYFKPENASINLIFNMFKDNYLKSQIYKFLKGESLEAEPVANINSIEIDPSINPLSKLNDFKNNSGRDVRFVCNVKQIDGNNYNSASVFLDNVLSNIF